MLIDIVLRLSLIHIYLEYQISKKFGIFATGGYGLTRYYNKSEFVLII